VLVRFEVSMAVNVESFELHAFHPILLHKTTGYSHGIFNRHCLCFEVFQLHHSIRKKLARKFFWAKYSEMGVFKRHTISYEKRFKLFFTKIKTKAILEIGLCTSHFSVAT